MTNPTTPAAPNWTGWEAGKPFDYLNSKTGKRKPAGRVNERDEDGSYWMEHGAPDNCSVFNPDGSCTINSDWRVADPLPSMTDRALAFTRDQAAAGNAEARAALEEIEPVDPLLKEAREIAAKWCEQNDLPHSAVVIRAGECDAWSEVQCALAGLRRGIEIERERGK